MISKEEVEHIAKLARLELSEKEIGKMQKDLSAILDYFNLLKNVPEIKAEGAAVIKNNSWLREDKSEAKDPGTAEKIIKAAPESKDDYIKVKTIL